MIHGFRWTFRHISGHYLRFVLLQEVCHRRWYNPGEVYITLVWKWWKKISRILVVISSIGLPDIFLQTWYHFKSHVFLWFSFLRKQKNHYHFSYPEGTLDMTVIIVNKIWGFLFRSFWISHKQKHWWIEKCTTPSREKEM